MSPGFPSLRALCIVYMPFERSLLDLLSAMQSLRSTTALTPSAPPSESSARDLFLLVFAPVCVTVTALLHSIIGRLLVAGEPQLCLAF